MKGICIRTAMVCKSSIRPRFLAPLNHVLIPVYVFGFVERFGVAVIALMRVGATNSGAAARWIAEDRLSRLAVETGYDEIPLEGFTLLQPHGGSWPKFSSGNGWPV